MTEERLPWYRDRESWFQLVATFLMTILAVLVVVIFLLFALGGGTEHEDLEARLIVLEQEARFQSCISLIPPNDRSAADIAECQTQSVQE